MSPNQRTKIRSKLTMHGLANVAEMPDARLLTLHNSLWPTSPEADDGSTVASASNTQQLVVNVPGADPFASYNLNAAVYEAEFAEHARRTGRRRDGVREAMIAKLADTGGGFSMLLNNSDDEILQQYNAFISDEVQYRAWTGNAAGEDGETLRAAAKLRTTVQGASQTALVSLGLAKIQQLQALIDGAVASTLAATSQSGA